MGLHGAHAHTRLACTLRPCAFTWLCYACMVGSPQHNIMTCLQELNGPVGESACNHQSPTSCHGHAHDSPLCMQVATSQSVISSLWASATTTAKRISNLNASLAGCLALLAAAVAAASAASLVAVSAWAYYGGQVCMGE